MLIRHLPGDVLHDIKLTDRPEWGWDREYLRVLIDAVQGVQWMVAASVSKNPPKKPKPFPRPHETEERSIARVLEHLKRRKEHLGVVIEG